MNLKKIFILEKKPPLILVAIVSITGLLGLKEVFTEEIQNFRLRDHLITVGFYFLCWFLIKGKNWARKIMIGFSVIAVLSLLNAEKQNIKMQIWDYIDMVFFAFFPFYLFSKPMKEYFGVGASNKIPKVEHYRLIKKCSNCDEKLSFKNLTQLLKGREFKCHSCGAYLRQTRRGNLTWFDFLVMELIFVPLICMPLFFFTNETIGASLFMLSLFLIGLYLKLDTTGVVQFDVQDEKYLNEWTKGGGPGKAPTEEEREVILNVSYDEAFQRCREAIEKIGAKFDWQDLSHGIVRGYISMRGNSFGELILCNIERVEGGLKIKMYSRNAIKWALADFSRNEFIIENLYKAMKGEEAQNVYEAMRKQDIFFALPLIGGLFILAKSFDITVGDVVIMENTFNGFGFFLVAILIYFGIYKFFNTPITKLFEKYFYSLSFKKPKNHPAKAIITHMMLLPVFAIIHSFLYLGNSYFDNTEPEVIFAYVGGLEKVGDEQHRDYCFYVYLDEKEKDSVTDKRYCFKKGYQGLRQGDKVKLLTKNGFFGVKWALDIDITKYESLDSLVAESGSLDNINMNDIYHVKPQSKNYREIASVWESECSKDKVQYCRLNAYLKGKENKSKEQIDLLRRACDKGDSESCFNLFALKKMPENETKLYKEKIEKQCTMKNPEGCYYFGSMKFAESGYKNFKLVKKYFKIACEGKVMNSCTDLKVIELEEI